MKAAISSGVAAAVLFGLGAACWTASRWEQGAVDARRDLARLAYAESIKKGSEAERRLGAAGMLPWAASTIAELREHRAAAEYWLADYAALRPLRDAEGSLLERDPEILFLAANAAYRSAQASPDRQDRQAALRQMDLVIKAYADVLKSNPDHVDAAYNYEYVARLRDFTARTNLLAKSKPEALLGPPTIHGHPGALPAGADMSQFKVVVPRQGEEKPQGDDRKDAPGATAGKEKVRKG